MALRVLLSLVQLPVANNGRTAILMVCVKLRKTTFRAYMTIKEELEHLFHTKVDLITLHENMRQMFRHNLEQDAIYV